MDKAAGLMIPDVISVPRGQIDYKDFEIWFRKKYNWTPCPGTVVGLVDYLKLEEEKSNDSTS